MPGTKIFIVDKNGVELSADNRGEIIIAGPNVSPGYRWTSRPHSARFSLSIAASALIETGDLGHFRDSLLFFDGRID